jgi:hypothetical protein
VSEATPATAASPSLLPSLIRTVVPLIVGVLITAGLKVGLNIPEGDVTALVTALITAIYYAAVRLIERKFPAAGWLLGYAASPTYTKAPARAADTDAGDATLVVLVLGAVLLAILVTYIVSGLTGGGVHSALADTVDPLGKSWL